MATHRAPPHALHRAVPFVYDPDGVGPVQPGLPGVLPEEAPLPSEVALSGGVLVRRQREAAAALRAELVDRPDEFSPEEWRVAGALLAPPAMHLGRAPGSTARAFSRLSQAKACFPHLSPSAAVAAFQRTARLPHVAAFVARLRSLEALDIMEQRALVRDALRATLANASALYDDELRANPGEWAKVSACITTAAKVLADLDALHTTPAEVQAVMRDVPDEVDGGQDDGDANTLREKIGKVGADLRSRAVVVG